MSKLLREQRKCREFGPYAGNRIGEWYRCTLIKGHEGDHQYRGINAIVQWPQKKTPPPPKR